jgi:hypothetical protein
VSWLYNLIIGVTGHGYSLFEPVTALGHQLSPALADAYIQLNKLLVDGNHRLGNIDDVLSQERILTVIQEQSIESLEVFSSFMLSWLPLIREHVLNLQPMVDQNKLDEQLQALHRAVEGYMPYNPAITKHVIGVSWAIDVPGPLAGELIISHRDPDKSLRNFGYKRTHGAARTGIPKPERLPAPVQLQSQPLPAPLGMGG